PRGAARLRPRDARGRCARWRIHHSHAASAHRSRDLPPRATAAPPAPLPQRDLDRRLPTADARRICRAPRAWHRYLSRPADQRRASDEVKRDMERARPMDRLLVGDVGYGKTEVAVRAAFKAVQAGKQVAVLVPTTILAEQHGRTFRERLADYPVRIEVLSRFRSTKEATPIVQRLAGGELDIVIGTHRLLSRDVGFHDL